MSYRETYELWRKQAALDDAQRAELDAICNDEKEIESRFFSQLSFGTAGLRGIMGMGLYRMNEFVIRHATQSFANVISQQGQAAKSRGIAICFDCRIHSQFFAREAACVMAANGIPVFLFENLRPTPELSFAVREYGCIAGINITASHNPKEYNGYKVYWEDGAQLPPEPATRVAEMMQQLDVFESVVTMDYAAACESGMIKLLGQETDEKFLHHVMALVNDRQTIARVADTFSVVYTPFHGTGYELIPKVLKDAGIKNLYCEPQQMVVDGNFPTVVSPNPENPEGFALSVALAKKVGADFILGSDPDADRVGIMVRTKEDDFVVISGNQTGVLLLDYLIGAMKRAGKMPENPVALKSLVTTEMARKVAQENGVTCIDTFTGFKFMAERKDALEERGEGKVIFSYEESFGYMLGDFVRDKDAVSACLMLTEMAAWYAGQGMTLYDALQALFEKYGYYGEKTLNLVMPGVDGIKKMADLMQSLRENPPVKIADVCVKEYKDYADGSVVNAQTKQRAEMELSGSNVLRYEMEDGTSLIVRPSGTEPKVKVYILAQGQSEKDCNAKISAYEKWAESLKK